MAYSSHSKKDISVDLFNLLPLRDKRKSATSYFDIPNNFFLPDGKNSKISQIINRWIFDRETPDGNDGFLVELPYLNHAYGTKNFVIDKVTGKMSAVYEDRVETIES